MANPFIIFVLFSIVKIASARFVDGLYLDQERLKYGNDITMGNDYMDYNPETVPKNIIIEVPHKGGNYYIGVPSEQRTVIEVQKVWNDDGSVTENIDIHPVQMARRDVNPSREQAPSNVDSTGWSEVVRPTDSSVLTSQFDAMKPAGLDLNSQFEAGRPRYPDPIQQPYATVSKEVVKPSAETPRNIDFGILGFHAVPY